MRELLQRGKPMRWAPVNMSEDQILNRVAEKATVPVILEPGDATNYQMILSPASLVNEVLHFNDEMAEQALVIIRLIGGDPRGVSIYSPGYEHALEGISNGNAWTQHLMTWWFETLFEKLNA